MAAAVAAATRRIHEWLTLKYVCIETEPGVWSIVALFRGVTTADATRRDAVGAPPHLEHVRARGGVVAWHARCAGVKRRGELRVGRPDAARGGREWEVEQRVARKARAARAAAVGARVPHKVELTVPIITHFF